jgi:tRNA nucleotidyltransferase (CCA-adding enzyme)
MDLDCFGSITIAKYLYPGIQPVQSQLIHPAAKNLYNLYRYRFGFINPKELKGKTIDEIVIVDTRATSRVDEYFRYIEDFRGKITVYDHHPPTDEDIVAAAYHYREYGANTTILVVEAMEKGIRIESEDATIALTAIYADTGAFQHENVTRYDLVAAAYLMEQQASIKLVSAFLRTVNEKSQVALIRETLNRLTYKNINGHYLILSYLELEDKVGGLATVTEKVFEVESAEAIFCVFHFSKSHDSLVVARSAKDNIRLDELLREFGGGGHPRASSALIKNSSGMMVFARLEEHLKNSLSPAFVAGDLMVKAVDVLRDGMTLMEASLFLEEKGHTGAPVLTLQGELIGFLTLRDIAKGRKNQQMHASVKGFMTQKVVTASIDTTMREIGDILFRHNIGHLPIVQGKSLIGLITRTDYLQFMEKDRSRLTAVSA